MVLLQSYEVNFICLGKLTTPIKFCTHVSHEKHLTAHPGSN